ncbi:MAG: glyceraldehyde-3-phosphate dehydrogenase 1 [Trizodia sp. TS-e1964]|nr:MAG: glyceraldehyde-3-phosphate dehydrogenase 1 [Trizodia sp. TS-e1964]
MAHTIPPHGNAYVTDFDKFAKYSGDSGTSSPAPALFGRPRSKRLSETPTQRIFSSFRRAPSRKHTGDIEGPDGRYDAEAAAAATAASPLSRVLKGRHLQMIAIGGSIGTGLFVGSGKSLSTGGPAALLIAYTLVGVLVYCTVQALGEMAVLFPVAGSFCAFSTRFLDPAWGFAMGWNYAVGWLVVLPLEVEAAAITVDYWNPTFSSRYNAGWVAIFLFAIITINMFGVKGYGEAEFVFSIVKVVAVIGFIILGVILDCGGGPDGNGYIGGMHWIHPGAFNNGFKGLCSVFVTAAFAFGGTELVGLAAAETANPRKSLPTAVKQVFWRITIFYILSLLLIGLLVPFDDPRLIGASTSANASPFVIAIRNAGISGLDSIMNVVILISVLSVGNSSIYGSSRILAALADQGQAPKIFGYIDRKGRPLVSIAFASLLGFLAFLASSEKRDEAFLWMMAISGLSSVFTWGSICLAHVRFRAAWKAQGHTLDELTFKSQAGVLGSWLGFVLNVSVLTAQFWTGFSPPMYANMSTLDLVKNFFQAYLAAPIVLLCYVGYKLWYRTEIIRSKDMDLKTGLRDHYSAGYSAIEEAERRGWPRWKKIYRAVC